MFNVDTVILRGKPLADGLKYKCLGNSMAVSVIRWIGERIARHIGQRVLAGKLFERKAER